MGKNGKKWNRKRKEGEKTEKLSKKNRSSYESARPEFKTIVQYNKILDAYYAYQGLFETRSEGSSFIKCETDEERLEERKKFFTAVRSILPASFRIDSCCHLLFRKRIEEELQKHAGQPIEITSEDAQTGEKSTRLIPPIRRIPFVPLAYQLSVDRKTIRVNASLANFHEWLKEQQNSGFITRQETVSMIPPVVLSVEPHHAVLDMCAAPGSKTGQILEIVSHVKNGELEPRGFVVANDSDTKRAYMLVNNLRRLNSSAVFVCSVDAQFFPSVRKYKTKENANEGNFDRVLCDVPCSGDGTMRKNNGIWRYWNPLGSFALHPLQLGIALRGASLTKIGGLVCYSTCSMNPIENEAVVAEILRKTKGNLKLIDKRDSFEGLNARPGWSSWKVVCNLRKRKSDKNGERINPDAHQKDAVNASGSEDKKIENDTNCRESTLVEETSTPNERYLQDGINGVDINKNSSTDLTNLTSSPETTKIDSTCKKGDEEEIDPINAPFSWDEDSLRSRVLSLGLQVYDSFDDVPEHLRKRIRKSCFPPTAEERKRFHLEKCLRCLPHDMDTGGFFIALFEKTGKIAQNYESDKEKEVEVKTSDQANECEIVDVDAEEHSPKSQCDKEGLDGKGKKKEKLGWDLGEADFTTVSDDIILEQIEFYGLSDNFPKNQIMARATGKPKVLYFISRAIKEQLIDKGIQRTTVINSGLKAFQINSRKDGEADYRVVQEGIYMIAPYMTKRIYIVKIDDFSACLSADTVKFDKLSTSFVEKVKLISVGAFVIVLEGYEKDFEKKMIVVMWRCRGDALNRLVGKSDLDGIMCKLRAITESNKEAKDSK